MSRDKPDPSDPPRGSILRSILLVALGALGLVAAGAAPLLARQAALSREAAGLGRGLAETIQLNMRIQQRLDACLMALQIYLERPGQEVRRRFEDLYFELGDLQVRYGMMDIDTDERRAVERIRASQGELGLAAMQVFESTDRGAGDGARAAIRKVQELEAQLDQDLSALSGLQAERLNQSLGRARQAVFMSTLLVAWVGTCFLLAFAALVVVLRRRVLAPLQDMATAAGAIRRGDFAGRVPVRRQDEVGRVATEFNYMAAELASIYANLERKVEERTRALKDVQKQLIHAERLSAVGQLVSGVAHELNNPLTAIIGFAEVEEGSLSLDPDRTRLARNLGHILTQAERCRRIVASLLQFARRPAPRLEPCRLGAVVAEALKLREYELSTGDVNLHADPPEHDPVVEGDRFKLQQAVLILVNNAVDAIRQRGGPGHIWVEVAAGDGEAVLEVRDDGTGLKEAGRVFEPFYTTKPVGEGTGLGLSICYGIVEEHGGRIVGENWDRGARFVLSLPQSDRKVPREAAAPPAEAPPPPLHQKVLVVDDEVPVLDLQVEYLSELGLQVTGVASGEAAITFLEQHQVDLIISDVRMPGPVDGLGLYRWVCSNRPSLERTFLFTSGDPSALGTGPGVGLPAECLAKPYAMEELGACVRRLLARRVVVL